MPHDHDHGHGLAAGSDRRWLFAALALLLVFMAGEVVAGLIAGSLALLSDAAHMLTDVASLILALVAMNLAARPAQGAMTYGLRRAEILSAQLNGATLLVLGGWFAYEGILRLIHPPQVEGKLVLVVALIGVAVNIAATMCVGKANRKSLNVEGAFQHILTDLYAFIATVVAGLAIWLTGFVRADALAALVVAALMLRSGWGLVRAASRILLEAAPTGFSPDAIGAQLVAMDEVVEVHDLHIWEISSGQAALSAHVLVTDAADCHERRVAMERLLREEHGVDHTTIQVDHFAEGEEHCEQAHGRVHRSERDGTAPMEQTGRHEHHSRS
ncbi:cation diffusion facilitator family transporter [Segniliparus rugosus]|uniref:Cation diffusion facilitator family transporter n=1 Tax=Segniliparus rugosus (strain ATCC BAA-974 / DSM 45345 / CCUG 50838 / CIP 108380 / JCM 13579 / CDC 945) TaxID=679197 RepID=E5XQ60_SEGRC|nr:cation diffusion facilitator family transporter [Segniliparus rugosus]EFV13514.1 cation diffusion facilitator family transporter [Segniliparus rugosus ATCC BAA-974]